PFSGVEWISVVLRISFIARSGQGVGNETAPPPRLRQGASGDRGQSASSPCSTVTAWPPRDTRSPLTRTPTTPPPADAWQASSSRLPRCSDQYGPRAPW